MLDFFIILLVLQLIGEALSKAFALPLPGPVIGMALLFAGLVVRGGVPDGLKRVTQGLLDHLSLLFVPAGVGVLVHVSVVADEWLPITVGLVGGTVITIALTGLLMAWLGRASGHGRNAPADSQDTPDGTGSPPGRAP